MMNAFIPSPLNKRGTAFEVYSKPGRPNSSGEEKRSITIAIEMDGLGWRMARESGFLREELPYRGPMAATFGPDSVCEPTILTGVKPREHGHFAPFTYDPKNSPFRRLWWLGLLPHFLRRRGRVQRWFSRRLLRRVGKIRHFEIFNTPLFLLKEMDYTAGRDWLAATPAGGPRTLFDDLRDARVPFHVCDEERDDAEKFEELRGEICEAEARFAYMSLNGLRHMVQSEGTRSPRVTAKLASYEDLVRELVSVAREHYDDVTLSVFSGHGMTDVRKERALMQIVNSLPLEIGRDYFAVYEATMARFWFMNDEAKRRIEALLGCHPDGEWLSEEKLRAWGCDFVGHRYGEKLFLLKPGVMLNPNFMGRRRMAAVCGYDPSHEDSTAFFATSDPRGARPKGLEDLRRLLTLGAGLKDEAAA